MLPKENRRTAGGVARRPYHAGSVLGPAPAQEISAIQQSEWLNRLRGYWSRPNARAGDLGLALVGFMGIDGAIFPSMETLADRIGITSRAVSRWVARFVKAGFLRVIRRRTLFGQTSNGYLILLPDPDAEASETSAPVEPLNESAYRQGKDSDPLASTDTLSRPSALRRLNTFLGAALHLVRPEPQPPRFTVAEQIALLRMPLLE